MDALSQSALNEMITSTHSANEKESATFGHKQEGISIEHYGVP
jgi:hypothetical protein